ncbi:hypothetical protein evm_010412 [Chilo suppressalis]|nr:hypothetical protein evm_010412 [Chilo suppressalis]
MKLIAVMCFSVVFYVDSVCGMSFDELFSYIPGWDTVTKTWNQIKEAIKKPVKVRRWGRVKRRKTATTTTATNSTSKDTTESLLPYYSIVMPNTSMNNIVTSKLLTPLFNSRESTNRRFPDGKTFFHFIYRTSTPSTSSLDMDPIEKPAASILKLTSGTNTFSPTKNRSASAGNFRYFKVHRPTTRSLTNTIVWFSTEKPMKSASMASLPSATMLSTSVNEIFKNLTFAPPEIYLTFNETKVNLPYIPNPKWRSAEDWKKIVAPPFAATQETNETDNDTEMAIALEGDANKGLSESKDADYSFFGSLVFI